MSITTEIAGLQSETRNCRRLAAITEDAAAKTCLEQLATRYDAQCEQLEAIKASVAEFLASERDNLALDRVGAIEILDEELELAGS